MPVAMLPIVADDELTPRLAEVLRSSRLSRGLSTAALAEGSGVSRASIVKLERAESQPSAALLGRLCPPLGLTLSELFARVERPREDSGRLLRAGQAPVWTDPASGYRRVSRSPLAGGPLQLTEIELPPGASITYPADAYRDIHQQVWVLAGDLELVEDGRRHELGAGDCLELGPAADCTFTNHRDRATRYLVAVARR
ncbi:XRE family transcriptional regulator [Kineococcus sp. NBC_00420]|uniref:helix-turn-helix domain-containing protein n=1 Tax=Kineococcus sp. NBC_00420 TaxID=2903564 RepID=UPI002E1C6957